MYLNKSGVVSLVLLFLLTGCRVVEVEDGAVSVAPTLTTAPDTVHVAQGAMSGLVKVQKVFDLKIPKNAVHVEPFNFRPSVHVEQPQLIIKPNIRLVVPRDAVRVVLTVAPGAVPVTVAPSVTVASGAVPVSIHTAENASISAPISPWTLASFVALALGWIITKCRRHTASGNSREMKKTWLDIPF
jgi:hypothetical protein